MDFSRFNRAVRLASIAHKNQFRKGTKIPYITHPYSVGMLLAQTGCSEEAIIAGILHDTVEDTKLTDGRIRYLFGEKIAVIVAGCSEHDKKLEWKKRKEHTIAHIKSASLEVKQVTCADKLHNITSMLEDYSKCGEALWIRFNAGRSDQEWYYRSLAAALSEGDFKSHKLSVHFNEAVSKLFPKSN